MGYFDVSKEEITEGSLLRSLVLISVPLLLQNAVMIGQQVIDLFWLGQFSGNAVAALGFATPVVWLLIGVCINGVYSGTKVVVSQRFGGDDERGARRAGFAGVASALLLGLVGGGAVYLLAGPLIDLVTGIRPGDGGRQVARMAAVYIEIISLWIFVAGVSDVIEACFIARGDSKATLYVGVAVATTNVAVDPLLIFGVGPFPAMGMRGAALATVAAYVAGLLLGLAFVARGRAGGIFSWGAVGFDPDDFRQIADVGAPSSVRSIASNAASMAIIVVVFAAGGAAGVAAYTVGSRVSSIALLSAQALSSSVASVVGQNIGAGNPGRATASVFSGLKLGFGFLVTVAALQIVFAEAVIGMVAPSVDGTALELSLVALQVFAIAYPASGVISLLSAGFNAARRTKTTMAFSVSQKWLIQIPLAVAMGLSLSYGPVGVFWARTLSSVLIAVAFLAYYLRENDAGLYADAVQRASVAADD